MQKNNINVTLRSHLTPSIHIEGYQPGKKIGMRLNDNLTVRDLVQQLFPDQQNRIGIIAVNGTMARDTQILQDGDAVDIYSLMPGG